MTAKKIWISILFLLVLIFATTGGYRFWKQNKISQDTAQQKAVVITNFFVEKPDFVVTGRNLSAVEIWAIPVSEDTKEENDLFIGKATLRTSVSADEKWALSIPSQPISVIKIYAKGFDGGGKEVARATLAFVGESDIYLNVWGPVTENIVGLAIGEQLVFGDLEMTFTKIVQDSRCPKDAVCVTAGDVTVEVSVVTPRKTQKLQIQNSKNPVLFDGYFIEVNNVEPIKTSEEISKDKYRVTFIVSRDAKL